MITVEVLKPTAVADQANTTAAAVAEVMYLLVVTVECSSLAVLTEGTEQASIATLLLVVPHK